MEKDELARMVAAELGPQVVGEVEREIKGEPPSGGGTRAFGITEAMAIAGFLYSCADVVIEVLKARKDRALLLQDLAEGLDIDPRLAARLDPEKRLGVMARIVNTLIPERIGSSPSLPLLKPRSKQEWVSDWLGFDANAIQTRSITPSVLMPFADMDNFIVYKPIYWTPPAGADADLPRAVTVPEGFVTDLATIPPYFWWAIQPTGRHGHAAILHDWLYWEQGVSRAVADKVFEVVMCELNVSVPVAKAMWAAVRVGGGTYWDEAVTEKRQGQKRVLKRYPEKTVAWEDWRKEPDVFA